MGCGVTFECTNCTWGQSFTFGVGMSSFNNGQDLERVRRGDFGILAQRAIDALDQDDMNIITGQECFACPECGEPVAQQVLIAYGQDRIPVKFYDGETACPSCGAKLLDGWPMPEHFDLAAFERQLEENGCPRCGARVERASLNWD